MNASNSLFGVRVRGRSSLAASDLDWPTLDQFAPSLPDSFSRPRRLMDAAADLEDGIGDFEILELLGEGAFGKVFLARQISLARLVALKLTADYGYEGRTMARLEHPRIVQVYSESVDTDHGLRMLCMQYVPGLTLSQIINQLRECAPPKRSGRRLLGILDRYSRQPPALDPCSLRDRDVLAGSTMDEAVCWIGQQLAEALAYAHARGILHRDVKPANVLLNQYGQPVLTDFSVSFHATAASKIEAAIFGGTLGYMAPEHRRALDPTSPAGSEAVDERSDIYSFGQVLLELATCHTPQRLAATVDDPSPLDGDSASGRPAEDSVCVEPAIAPGVDGGVSVATPLRRIIGRCLAYDPEKRYQSAEELAASLAGCRELLSATRTLPRGGRLTDCAVARPVFFILLFTILPNVLASCANVLYISFFVVKALPPQQQAAFEHMVFWYNAVLVPVMYVMVDRTLLDVARNLQADLSGAAQTTLRRRALALPGWCVALGLSGWLPFTIVVPVGMRLFAGPIEADVLWNISVAFLLTGLIATTVNYFVVSFVVVRSIYPAQWKDAARYRETAARELAPLPSRNRLVQILAALPPLVAAMLVTLAGPTQFDEANWSHFRILVSVLIVAGLIGSWFSTAAASVQNRCIAALTLGERA